MKFIGDILWPHQLGDRKRNVRRALIVRAVLARRAREEAAVRDAAQAAPVVVRRHRKATP